MTSPYGRGVQGEKGNGDAVGKGISQYGREGFVGRSGRMLLLEVVLQDVVSFYSALFSFPESG